MATTHDKTYPQQPTPEEPQKRAATLGSAAQKQATPDMGNPDRQPSGPSRMPSRETEGASPRVGARLMDIPTHNLGPKPPLDKNEEFALQTNRRIAAKMQPTLGQQAVAVGIAPTPAPEKEAGQGDKGRGEGERERPTDPSFYTGSSPGGIAIPERDTKGAEIAAARRAVDRSRARGMGH